MIILQLITSKKSLKYIIYYGIFLLCIPLFVIPIISIWFNVLETLNISPFELWKILSMLWAMAFGVYYLFHFKLTGKEWIDKTIPVLAVFASLGLPVLSIIFTFTHNIFWHLVVDFGLAMTYFLSDIYLAKNHTDKNEKIEYKLIHYIGNVPIVFTFILFLTWSAFHYKIDGWHNFMNGFLATVFITINIVFIMIQSGIIKQLYNCDDDDE